MNKSPDAGSFFTPDEDPYQSSQEQPEQKRAFGPEVSEGLVEQLKTFKETLHPDAKVIYYPCCQNDTSISAVFPESRIIYADINANAIKMLESHGFEAVVADATKYEPDEQLDIVMLQNPAMDIDKPASLVKDNGYLICNNYHDTAININRDNNFELVGVVVPKGKEGMVLDKASLADYFTTINTDEELKRMRVSWGNALTYETALDAVKEYGEDGAMQRIEAGSSSIIEEYKKVLEKFKHLAIPNTSDIVFLDENGRTVILETEFPPKKGGADDLFVFKKTKKPEEKK